MIYPFPSSTTMFTFRKAVINILSLYLLTAYPDGIFQSSRQVDISAPEIDSISGGFVPVREDVIGHGTRITSLATATPCPELSMWRKNQLPIEPISLKPIFKQIVTKTAIITRLPDEELKYQYFHRVAAKSALWGSKQAQR